MSKERRGILAGGNWIVDRVKIIDSYPAQETLSNILSESVSNGGSPYNILKDLSKLGAPFPLAGIGLIGNDEAGKYILQDCGANNIDSSQITTTDLTSTSYTDVMTGQTDGKRTFFHYRGANALLANAHFKNLEKSSAKIFHLGYLLLLDKMDEILSDGNTVAANVLKLARDLGFKTSVDLVSENSDRFKSVVTPALPFIDYLFINEFEAEKLTGVETTFPDKSIDVEGCLNACRYVLDKGVNEWVILHFPNGCIAVNRNGHQVYQGSVKVPQEKIQGTVGAGDAFASGVLFGLHEGLEMKECLELGVCAAAACIHKEDCSSGVLSKESCLELGKMFDFRDAGVRYP
ncbi:MAG TPA: PfkB family carbohydrate kinase [Cytophagaceae bacterium]|jgi:sugar/nucleoside kinase (ribokinase family)